MGILVVGVGGGVPLNGEGVTGMDVTTRCFVVPLVGVGLSGLFFGKGFGVKVIVG